MERTDKSMLYITDNDIKNKYTMKECLEDVVQGFKYAGEGKVQSPNRIQLNHKVERTHSLYMPSYIEGLEFASIKIVSLFPPNATKNIPMIQSVILLTETDTGKHLAIMRASHLTVMRTGAISGVATKYLSREDSETLAVIGCGTQSLGQIQAVMEVRSISKIILYNRTQEKAAFLKEKISTVYSDWKGETKIEKDPNVAVSKADIVVSSTSSDQPVYSGDAVTAGTHINAVGSCEPTKQEYDAKLLQRSDKVIVDTLVGAKQEAGGLIIPDKTNEWSMSNIYGELSEIITGKKKGRETKNEITLLDSVGIGFLDTVCAVTVYNKFK